MDKRAKLLLTTMAKKKLSQKELGEKLGITQQAVKNFIGVLEKGSKPRFSTAQKYAEVLGLDVEKLL